MRYEQNGGVHRVGNTDEYRVTVHVYLTPEERDLWGARKTSLTLTSREEEVND